MGRKMAAALLAAVLLWGCAPGQENGVSPEESLPERVISGEEAVPVPESSREEPESPAPAAEEPSSAQAASSSQPEPQQPAFPQSFVLEVTDQKGIPAQNAQIFFPDGEFPGFYRCNSRGQAVIQSQGGAGYGRYRLSVQTVGAGGESTTEEIQVELTARNIGGIVPVQMAGKSRHQEIRQAEDRVEICILDPEGNPIPDLWVSTNLMGDRFPDTAGLIIPGEGYTDQDGTVVFDQYDSPYASREEQTGVKRVSLRLDGGWRDLQDIRVPDEPGVKRYTYTVDLDALPKTFTLRMLDRDGLPIQNTKAVVTVSEEDGSMMAITNSRGEITLETAWFPSMAYGKVCEVTLELDPVPGGQGVVKNSFTPSAGNIGRPIEIQWDLSSPYEALKTASDRVEVTIRDGEGNPLPDIWVSAGFGGEKAPDVGGSKSPYEGYTDQEGRIYFTRYNAGEISLGVSLGGEYRKLGTMTVEDAPGVQSFVFALE